MHTPRFRTPHPRHRRAAALLAIGCTMSLLTGCATGDASPSSSTDATPVSGGTLTYAVGDEPICLDPHYRGNLPQGLIAGQIFDSLVSLDDDGNVIPWLADSWETSDDGLTLTMTLKQGVTFHDGTDFNADAVVANVEHIKDPDTASSTAALALARVDSVEASDEYTAVFHLSEPDSWLLNSLAQSWLGIESPTALAQGTDYTCENPVGTGAFQFVSWTKQDNITLARNENYTSAPADASHTGAAYLDTLVWRIIPDTATRYAALQSGAVDVIDAAQPENLVSAENTEGLATLVGARPGASIRLELNTTRAPFDDENVREAFIRSVDVDTSVASLFSGTVERSYSALGSTTAYATSEQDEYSYDPDLANELLDAAGWTERDEDGYRVKDGQRLTVEFPVANGQSIPAEQSLFEQIAAMAKEVGFDVQITLKDLNAWYTENVYTWDYDLVSNIYTKNSPDVLRLLYTSSGTISSASGYHANAVGVQDPELDELLETAATTSDAAEQEELCAQAQEILAEGHYILPLYDQQSKLVYSTSVHGLRLQPNLYFATFYDAWIE